MLLIHFSYKNEKQKNSVYKKTTKHINFKIPSPLVKPIK